MCIFNNLIQNEFIAKELKRGLLNIDMFDMGRLCARKFDVHYSCELFGPWLHFFQSWSPGLSHMSQDLPFADTTTITDFDQYISVLCM